MDAIEAFAPTAIGIPSKNFLARIVFFELAKEKITARNIVKCLSLFLLLPLPLVHGRNVNLLVSESA